VPGERLGDRVADRAAGRRGHQGEHRAAEPAADHPRAVRARGQRRLCRRVGLGPGHLEVVAQRRVRLRQQPPDGAIRARRTVLAGRGLAGRGLARGGCRGAQQRHHLQDALVVRDDVPGSAAQDRIGQPVGITQVR
jgi:hypothetical protein